MTRARGQEEIVGFVVVMVLMAIILLIMLSFSLRTNSKERVSIELQQLLESIGETHAPCSVRFSESETRIGTLYNACAEGVQCLEGISSCTVLNQRLVRLLNRTLSVGVDRPVKGYSFIARVSVNNTSDSLGRPFLTLSEGNCTTNFQWGASDIRPADRGVIRVSLQVCY